MCCQEASNLEVNNLLKNYVVIRALFSKSGLQKSKKGAEGQTRTVDTGIFSAVLYHLSYLGLGHLLSNPSYCLSRLQVSLPRVTRV